MSTQHRMTSGMFGATRIVALETDDKAGRVVLRGKALRAFLAVHGRGSGRWAKRERGAVLAGRHCCLSGWWRSW